MVTNILRKYFQVSFVSIFLLFASMVSYAHDNYRNTIDSQPKVRQFTVANGRSMELWSWYGGKRGVIFFSHGFGLAPWKYTELFNIWLKAGYIVHAPLHMDSADHPQSSELVGLQSWVARLEDMQFLSEAFGTKGYIAAGHSFGALTALAKGGVTTNTSDFTGKVYDENVEVVLAFSPPGVTPSLVDANGYGDLRAPALIQTGTEDVFFEGGDFRDHLDAFENAPAEGNRYALVLEGVDHYFGGLFDNSHGSGQTHELKIAARVSILIIKAHADSRWWAMHKLNSLLSDDLPVMLKQK